MKNSTMPQKLVRLKPKELVDRYVDFLGRMQFDKAREFAELEKMRTNWMDFQTVDERHWPAFMAILAQLANLDSLYFSLSYLLSKFSFRKENNIKDVYTQLRSELVQIATDGNREKLADNLQSATTVQQLADQFMQFVSIRAGLVEFYTLLSIKNWRAFDEELQQLLNGKLWQWMEQEGESAAGNLFAACRNELTVLNQLHAAQRAMQECNAFEALLSLKRSANLLDNWFHALDASPILKPSGPSSFFAAFSSRRRSSISRFGLLQFLLQFHHTMVAKFSLYFHDTLIPYVPGAEMKQAFTMPVSYLQLFHTFFRKSNAHTVCLLLNRIDQDTPFQGFGYHYASTSTQIFLERNADDKLKASQYSSTAEGEATKQAELPLKKDCRCRGTGQIRT